MFLRIVSFIYEPHLFIMRNLIAAVFVVSCLTLHSQSLNEFRAADVIAMNAPDSCQASAASLGRYFSAAFKKPALRVRAIYTWTAMKISYDILNTGNVNAATPFNELVDNTMQSRKGICQGYASVFKALCDACGIPAWVVNGYTRQNGHINDISHAWVIAVTDSSYFGFDPTWGGGYMNKGKYAKQFSEQFFMVKPGVLIKDHMPFDPLWECLKHPISNTDFINARTTPSAPTGYFAFPDSIKAYQALDQKGQCSDALRRLQKAGVENKLLREWEDFLEKCIEFGTRNEIAAVKNKYVKQFNHAVASYNNCIYAFNQYADYWNRQFTPAKSQTDIVNMLDLCYTYLDSCKVSLSEVIPGDPDMKQSADQLKLAMDQAKESLDQQKVFLKIYFNTDPMSRPQLFKHYNGAGFPTKK